MNKKDKKFWKDYYTNEINKLESQIIGINHMIKCYKKELKELK
jgi:hypothetical protein